MALRTLLGPLFLFECGVIVSIVHLNDRMSFLTVPCPLASTHSLLGQSSPNIVFYCHSFILSLNAEQWLANYPIHNSCSEQHSYFLIAQQSCSSSHLNFFYMFNNEKLLLSFTFLGPFLHILFDIFRDFSRSTYELDQNILLPQNSLNSQASQPFESSQPRKQHKLQSR